MKRFKALTISLLAVLQPLCMSAMVHASDWTPLIESEDFDGMKADVLTAAGGIVAIVLVIIGLGWLVNAFVHR